MAYTIRLFGEVEFSGVADGILRAVTEQINGENPEYLLNVNRTQYTQHVVDKYRFDPLEIHFDGVEASPTERSVPAERFPLGGFSVEPGNRYTQPAFVYHVPFTGNAELLKCIPNPRLLNTYRVEVDGGEMSFEIIDSYGNLEDVKRNAESILGYMREQSGHLDGNVRRFNQDLEAAVQRAFEARKAKLLQQGQMAASLGVPIRMRPNVPTTFAVPATVRKAVTPRPASLVGPYRADPTIDNTIYGEILRAIQDTGRMFERLPSVYADKDEETLRDHLLMVLEPRFQITSTGETFNKTGKTDILMRHEGKNVFVAECKFWGGAKKHAETIDQILSYLTFRDSKAAIIYFVDTKEMTAPLKAVEESTPAHPTFVASKGRIEDTWFSYEFHLPGDPGRSVQLAMLCFHLPK
jgi:hypothetical protein